MEHLSSAFPATPELSHLYERLRKRAFRQLLRQQRHTLLVDALASAVQDGFMIFLRKLRTADLQVQHPEAFAFEIIKRTFWDYRRRAQRPESPQDPAELPAVMLHQRERFSNGNALFASLSEPYLWQWYQQLSASDQQFIDLRCLGYKDREIAELLHLSYGGVRNQFSKLLRSAREVAKAS